MKSTKAIIAKFAFFDDLIELGGRHEPPSHRDPRSQGLGSLQASCAWLHRPRSPSPRIARKIMQPQLASLAIHWPSFEIPLGPHTDQLTPNFLGRQFPAPCTRL
jgi:hypothetical protein